MDLLACCPSSVTDETIKEKIVASGYQKIDESKIDILEGILKEMPDTINNHQNLLKSDIKWYHDFICSHSNLSEK